MPQSQTIHVTCHTGCVNHAADTTTSGYIRTRVQRELSGKHLPMFVRLRSIVLHIVLDATTHAPRMFQKTGARLQSLQRIICECKLFKETHDRLPRETLETTLYSCESMSKE